MAGRSTRVVHDGCTPNSGNLEQALMYCQQAPVLDELDHPAATAVRVKCGRVSALDEMFGTAGYDLLANTEIEQRYSECEGIPQAPAKSGSPSRREGKGLVTTWARDTPTRRRDTAT